MRNLKPAQLKALSEFLNTIAAAWFSAGVISPFFIKTESLIKTMLLAVVPISMSLVLLVWSISVVRRVKL